LLPHRTGLRSQHVGESSMHESQRPDQPVLFGITGPAKGRKVVLGPDAISVGRRDDMTVSVPDPKLSAHHADIVQTDGGCVLRDCMSTNGTFVNGELVAEAQLAPNDRIRMGRSEFVFTQLGDLDEVSAMLGVSETAELVSDSHTSVLSTPKVQVSMATQSVQVQKVCATDETPVAHKLCSLYEVGRRINVLSGLDALLDLVVCTILEEMHADRTVLLLFDEETGELTPAVTRCREGITLDGPVQVSETIVRQAVESEQSILTEDAGSDERFTEGESISLVGIRSAMCVPLLASTKVIGVAYVDKLSHIAAFGAEDLEFLTVLCNSAAISIENARLFSEVQARNREVTEANRQIEASYRELEKTQQKLIQAEKLSSLGRLVAGIAHDLKNILTSVTGYAQLLRMPAPDDKRATYVERLNETTAMCTKMVRDLMGFARQDDVMPEPANLNTLATEAIDIASTSATEAGVEIVHELAEELPTAHLDPLQMVRVLTNLVTNAVQAMADFDGERRITVRTGHEADEVYAVVEDTGPGIPEEAMGQIFDPFFTTKPKGTGTGLGLSLCQGIVAAHGGSIEVESAPGKGARFTLRLPLEGPLCQGCGASAAATED
jgi:signal transduction histidine kinase/pSer/pThr/pTyr-binding forkhead associated (FHA) protein